MKSRPPRLHDPLRLEKQQLANLKRLFMTAAGDSGQLPMEHFASLLSRYTELEPSTINSIFVRMTNSRTISWDRFLQLLHNESLLRSTVLNERIAPSIPVELERVEPLVQVQRQLKKMNKEIRRVEEANVQNYQFLVVLVDNELMLVGKNDGKFALRMVFGARYQNRPQEGRKLSNVSQYLTNNSAAQLKENSSMLTQTQFASGILTRNLKKSIKLVPDRIDKAEQADRAEASSSSHTNQNSFHERKSSPDASSVFIMRRTATKKKHTVRVKRSNIDQIFRMFKELPPEKDVELCRLYSESDEPQFVIDKTLTNFLQRGMPPSLLPPKQRIDFKEFSNTMRRHGRELSYDPRRLSDEDESVFSRGRRISLLLKDPKPIRDKATAMENSAKKRNVFIHSYSIHHEYIAVALATKELRILKMRKYFFNKVITEELMCRSYPEPPLFVHLYECNVRTGKLFLMMAAEEEDLVVVRTRELTDKWELGALVFSFVLPFYPCFDVLKGIGVTSYNEMGQLSIFEIGGARSKDLVRCLGPYQLRNQSLSKKMAIHVVRYHPKTLSLIIGCLDGFLHTYSFAKMEPRKIRKLSSKAVTGLEVHEQLNCLITLAEDGKCRLINMQSFEVFCELDLLDRNVLATKGLYWKQNSEPQTHPNEDFFYAFGQQLARVYLTPDVAKQNKIRRQRTAYDERIKMFGVSEPVPATSAKDSFVMTKLWVSNGYLLLLSDNEEAMIMGLDKPRSSATRFFPRKTRNIVEMAACCAGILYALTDDEFNLEIANICTQQLLLALKLDGLSSIVFMPREMREIICVGTTRGDCILIKQPAVGLITEQKHPQQTVIHGNMRVDVTVCRIFDRLLVTGNDRGEVCIFTQSFYSLKHLIKLNILVNNPRMDSVVNIKHLVPGLILVLTSQPALFEVNMIEGSIISYSLLPAEHPDCITDFHRNRFCEKSIKTNSIKIFEQANGVWEQQAITAEQLKLLDLIHGWFVGADVLRVVSTNAHVADLVRMSGKWQVK